MEISFTYSVEGDYLHVTATAECVTSKNYLEYSKKVSTIAAAHGLKKKLLDHRGIVPVTEPAKIVELLSEITSKNPITREFKYAVVYSDEQLKEQQLMYHAAANRGIRVKHFSNLEDARTWLVSDS